MCSPAAIPLVLAIISTATDQSPWKRIRSLQRSAFAWIPELGELDTPNGHFTFLQAAAITEDEMNAMMCWNGEKFLALMALLSSHVRRDLGPGLLIKNAGVL